MFSIDLTVKNTAFPISIERKTSEDAEAVYQLIVAAMQTGSPDIVELTSLNVRFPVKKTFENTSLIEEQNN